MSNSTLENNLPKVYLRNRAKAVFLSHRGIFFFAFFNQAAKLYQQFSSLRTFDASETARRCGKTDSEDERRAYDVGFTLREKLPRRKLNKKKKREEKKGINGEKSTKKKFASGEKTRQKVQRKSNLVYKNLSSSGVGAGAHNRSKVKTPAQSNPP